MAGEMSLEDIQPGGDFYEVAQELYAAAVDAGFEGQVKPFDRYQGPYCLLINNQLVVGELWYVGDKFLCKVVDGRKEESKMVDSSKDLFDFVVSVWRDWHEFSGIKKIEDARVIDEFLIYQGEKYSKVDIGDELYCLVKYANQQILSYDYKYWVKA